jgi:hypothetical protein
MEKAAFEEMRQNMVFGAKAVTKKSTIKCKQKCW